ncbi:MAG: hypothetical protein NDJ90_06175 [Oligoflexia bacterium]|nr:hypothetical protein [Oligoflexia bacterium]
MKAQTQCHLVPCGKKFRHEICILQSGFARRENCIVARIGTVKKLLISCFCLTLLSAQAPSRRVEVPEARLSFVLPSEMKEVPVRGVDSFVLAYESPALKLLIDYGPYSDSFRSLPEGAEDCWVREELIDGKNAKLVTYRLPRGTGGHGPGFPYFAGVHFADLGRGPRLKLTFAASGRSEAAQSAAVEIMKSIVFTTSRSRQ